MAIRAILWDFGNTLVDETWMLSPIPGVPQWPAAYRGLLDSDGSAARWMAGLLTTEDIVAELAGTLGISVERVRGHMERSCRNIDFYPLVRQLTETCRLPQAIVTRNPDIFSEVVVRAYALDSRFEPIVTSWEERTLDKGALCEVARRRLNADMAPAECLLIDNVLDCVRQWEARGGIAYHFRGEETLYGDFGALVGSESE